MGATWQTLEQRTFIEDHLPLFMKHLDEGTVNAQFWPDFFDQWFEIWPIPEPTPDLVQQGGSAEKAKKVEQGKQKSVSTVHPATECANLNLRVDPENQTCLQIGGRRQIGRAHV